MQAHDSPIAIGRLLGIAIASGLPRPSSETYENRPDFWREFMPESSLVDLIHATGGGKWRVDISRICDDDNDLIDDVRESVVRMCIAEFPRYSHIQDVDVFHRDRLIQQRVEDTWRAGVTLSRWLGIMRDRYADIDLELHDQDVLLSQPEDRP